MKKTSLKFLIIALFLSFVYIAVTEGIEDRVRRLAWVGWAPHGWGTFRTANGNAGLLNFWIWPTTPGYTWAHVLSTFHTWGITNTLTGYLWMETIWWVWPGDLSGVELYPDASWDPRGNWTLSGYLWSDSAWWIRMNDVVFVPDNTYFSGFAWSDEIGWIDMWWATLESTSSGFIWKVKVLGSIGWSRVFNTTYDVGGSYSSAKINELVNVVEKNIKLLTRNAGPGQINQLWAPIPEIFNDSVIYENTGGTLGLVRYSDITFRNVGYENVRSLIVIGANVYIDQAVLPPPGDTRPRAIIAMANSQGIWGNIYVAWGLTRIESSLIAGWSLYSAYFPPSTQTDYIYYNTDASSIAILPDRQLYVHGTIISHNTIGGSNPGNGSAFICPYTEVSCAEDTAIRYDFNYFRDFQRDPVKRGYATSQYDDWSFVIEYNPGIIRDPPPWLAE